MARYRASLRQTFIFFLLAVTTGSGLKLHCVGKNHICVSGSHVFPINLGKNPANQCELVNTTPSQDSDKSTTGNTCSGEKVNGQPKIYHGCVHGKDGHWGTCSFAHRAHNTQSSNQKHFIIHTPDHDKSLHLVISHETKPNIALTGNSEIDKKVGYGMLLMNTGNLDQAIEQFTNVIKEHPWVTAAFYGRGTAYVQKGMQIKENAEAAIQDFSSIIRLNPENADGWIKRAEVYSPLGHIKEALSDLKVALDLRPSAQLHLMSGTLLFMQENYEAASESFLKCLELDKNQHVALLYYGLSLYHRGRVKEAVENFKKLLELNANLAETHRSMGHAYRELGNAVLSYEHFTDAIALEPNVAQNYRARGILSYMRGRPDQALEDFKACLQITPNSLSCQYWKGVSYAARGNFYEAVKSSSKILLSHSSPLQNIDVIKSHYLKEYSRYLHSHLDMPLAEFSPDVDLDGRFRDHWVKSLPFYFKNYVEQPGIQPQIREVENATFDDLSPDAQVLLCKSSTLGPLVQYNSDGFLPSARHQRAMGLAMLEVSQVAHRLWKGGRSLKINHKKITWREIFDVAVKWRRLSEPEQPVFWLDMMPEKSVKTGFNVRISLMRGQIKSVRYSEYFDKIFQFTKAMLQHAYKVDESVAKDFRRKVEKTNNCRELMNVLKKHDTRNPQPGLILSTHVSSSKRGGAKSLTGLNLSLAESGSHLLFTMDTSTTPARTEGYRAELDFIWTNLNDEIRKPGNKDADAIGNHILSLVYYFFNLMPLSRGSSAVAYTVALGLFLAVGKDVTGKIPEGKEVDMEAMIGGSVENFTKHVKGWLGLKKLAKPVTSLPPVSDTFPTLRTVIESLNVQFTEEQCRSVQAA